MKKNISKKTNTEYFDFLASALSISGLFTQTEANRREKISDAAENQNDKYFDSLADALSIYKVVA